MQNLKMLQSLVYSHEEHPYGYAYGLHKQGVVFPSQMIQPVELVRISEPMTIQRPEELLLNDSDPMKVDDTEKEPQFMLTAANY